MTGSQRGDARPAGAGCVSGFRGGAHRPVRSGARLVFRVLAVPLAPMMALLLRLSSRRQGIAVVYHGLAARSGKPELELVAPHGTDVFERQVRHLARTYHVVPAADLQRAATERRRGARFPAAITFDDDLASHVELALPILRRIGVSATFCLTGATLKGPHSFWWQRLQHAVNADPSRLPDLFEALGAPARRTAATDPRAIHELARLVEALDVPAREAFARMLPDVPASAEVGVPPGGVQALASAGMAIGLHTRRHDPLPSLGDDALAAAFAEGRDELERAAGQRLVVVAYPHGRADSRVARVAREAGFTAGYTGVPVPVRAGDDPLILGRITPSHRSGRHLALQIVVVLLRRKGSAPRS